MVGENGRSGIESRRGGGGEGIAVLGIWRRFAVGVESKAMEDRELGMGQIARAAKFRPVDVACFRNCASEPICETKTIQSRYPTNYTLRRNLRQLPTARLRHSQARRASII